MKKNLLLSFAGVFAFVGFFGIVGVVIGNETNIQTHEVTRPVSSNWEKDFKWFDVEMKLKSGSVEKISIGIPLKDIDFSKVEKYDASFASPLSTTFNIGWIIQHGDSFNNEKLDTNKKLFMEQYMGIPERMSTYIDTFKENRQFLNSIRGISAGNTDEDISLCFAIIKFKDVCSIQRRVSNLTKSKKLYKVSIMVKFSNGKWKFINAQNSDELDEIMLQLSYYDKEQTLQSCWEKTRGKKFPTTYDEYIKSRQ